MLARQLAEDGAVADALWPDTGAHRVEAGLGCGDRDLGPQARLARDRTHLDGSCLDLGHLSLEQSMHEHAGRARYPDLCLALVSLGIEDHDEHRTAGMQHL